MDRSPLRNKGAARTRDDPVFLGLSDETRRGTSRQMKDSDTVRSILRALDQMVASLVGAAWTTGKRGRGPPFIRNGNVGLWNRGRC